jgi:hypothetical protein
MTALARAASSPLRGLPLPSPIAAGTCALGATVGVAVAAGLAAPIAALLLLGIGMLVGLRSWRLSILLLLAYIPVSGLLWIAMYPRTAPGALAKDFLFVIPAYAGFFGSYVAARRKILFEGLPLVALALLAALVLVEILNPSLDSLLVGLVGAKVWLFYIPLVFIGFHLIRGRRDLEGMLKVMCITGIIPAVVGIVEAVLLYTGNSGVVYSFYGDAAAVSTQQFTAVEVGGATLLRVPSTFSFVAQYYIFMTSMVAIGYAWWRMAPRGSTKRRLRQAVWVLFLIAVLTSGARGALAFIPLLLVAILVIEGRFDLRSSGVLIALFGGLLLMIGLIGANPGGVIGSLWENARYQIDAVVIEGAKQASNHLLIGLGTGADTIATRYVSEAAAQRFAVQDVWREGFWARSVLELGIGGLLLTVIVFGGILLSGLRVNRRLRDPGLKAVSASILGLMVWVLAYNVKAQYLAFDPLNLYFWLFTGILFKLPALERDAVPAPGPARRGRPPIPRAPRSTPVAGRARGYVGTR